MDEVSGTELAWGLVGGVCLLIAAVFTIGDIILAILAERHCRDCKHLYAEDISQTCRHSAHAEDYARSLGWPSLRCLCKSWEKK